jgi:hypothetical protein
MAKPKAEPKTKPDPKLKAEPKTKPDPKPKAEPKTKPDPKPKTTRTRKAAATAPAVPEPPAATAPAAPEPELIPFNDPPPQGWALVQVLLTKMQEAQGEQGKALRIYREELLPLVTRLGDIREQAVSLSKAADILETQGHIDYAVRIMHEEVLPRLGRLGDTCAMLVGRVNLALKLVKRAHPGDAPEIVVLLALTLEDARRLQLPEATQLENILHPK